MAAVLAPPFNPPWARYTTRPDPGSWNATRIDLSGNVVAQVGVEPTPPSVSGIRGASITAGYSYVVELPAGLYTFAASVTTSSVTLRADGADVLALAFMGIHPGADSRGGYAHNSTSRAISAGTTRLVQASGKLAAGWYSIRVALSILMFYTGKSKPYGEAIGSITTMPFTAGTAAPIEQQPRGPHDEKIRELLDRPIELVHDA